MRYVMYQFHTGECRLEPITPDRPVKQVVAELRARWGSRGYMKLVTDQPLDGRPEGGDDGDPSLTRSRTQFLR